MSQILAPNFLDKTHKKSSAHTLIITKNVLKNQTMNDEYP